MPARRVRPLSLILGQLVDGAWKSGWYQHPGIRPTCQLAEIKVHYDGSQATVNPSRIVPIGPDLAPAVPVGGAAPVRT